jgi:hypothetical protein
MCSNRAATRVDVLNAWESVDTGKQLFAAILQTSERPNKVSHRPCTAEGVGSSPIGSTSERAS